MASHPSCGVNWQLVPQSSIAVSLEKFFEFKFWQNQGANIFLHLYHRRKIAFVRNFYGASVVSKHDLHKRYPRIEFSKRNSQDLFCSGIGCQLTLNTLQKILTDRIITIFILQMKCNCTWPPSSDHLRTLSCGRLKSRMESFNFCQKKMVFSPFWSLGDNKSMMTKRKGRKIKRRGTIVACIITLIWAVIYFDWSALKMTKCKTHRKFWQSFIVESFNYVQ